MMSRYSRHYVDKKKIGDLRKIQKLFRWSFHQNEAQCLKIPEKVAFNIASEVSYVYILSGQKFIKNAKTASFGTLVKQCYQTGQIQ